MLRTLLVETPINLGESNFCEKENAWLDLEGWVNAAWMDFIQREKIIWWDIGMKIFRELNKIQVGQYFCQMGFIFHVHESCLYIIYSSLIFVFSNAVLICSGYQCVQSSFQLPWSEKQSYAEFWIMKTWFRLDFQDRIFFIIKSVMFSCHVSFSCCTFLFFFDGNIKEFSGNVFSIFWPWTW